MVIKVNFSLKIKYKDYFKYFSKLILLALLLELISIEINCLNGEHKLNGALQVNSDYCIVYNCSGFRMWCLYIFSSYLSQLI